MLTENEIIIAFATIAVFGIGAQRIGRFFGFPSLLLLLPAGLAAGALGLVDPEALLGDTLFPFVTLLVALLLFQSGMQLRFAEPQTRQSQHWNRRHDHRTRRRHQQRRTAAFR